MKRLFFILIATFFMIFWSCTKERPILEETLKLDDTGWFYQDSIQFDFDINEADLNYDLVLKMVHSAEYRNQNVYFSIKTIFPDGSSNSDITNFDLANNSGKWYGKCRGQKCKVQALLQAKFRVKDTGLHSFIISPHTRSNPLKGFFELEMELWDSSTNK